jgi:putative salt-induced outer membrane protein
MIPGEAVSPPPLARAAESGYQQAKEDAMRRSRLLLAVLIALAAAPAAARGEDTRWRDEAELSFVDTAGNTDVTTLSAKNTLIVPLSERLAGTWRLGALYGRSQGVRNAESYFTELRGDYSFPEKLYSFVNAGWFKDGFAGIDARYYVGAGLGCRVLAGPTHFILGEAGVTGTREETTDGRDRTFPGGRLFGKYEYRFTERNRFSQSLEALFDFDEFDNWNLNSETALVSALNRFLSLKASYVVKYDNEPVPGLGETDTVLAVTLVVNF